MRTNFDITIPSIPGKMIKFKIQDIKSSAFSSQRPRFSDNKSFLTKKFIDSFNNFHQKRVEPTQDKIEEETQSGSRINHQTTLRWRDMIPQDKKYLIVAFQKRKNEVPNQEKHQRIKSYTFHRQSRKLEPMQTDANQQDIKEGHLLTNNGFFNLAPRVNEPKVHQKPRRHAPSSIFKAQTRTRFYQKMQNLNIVPGPGKYTPNITFDQLTESKPKKQRNEKKRSFSQAAHPQIEYKALKSIITHIVSNEQHENRQIQENSQIIKQNPQLPSYNFMVDDRDRFGKQKFPIAWKVNVPGPGSYEQKRAIQQNAKKITIVQQQRRLLKQWFHQ